MNCPKCKNDMDAVEFEGIEVDWLLGKDAALAIDTGDPSIGRQMNEIDWYRCPRCDGGMMRKVDPKQTQIRFEECTSCRGVFLDAGEFADLVKDSIAELLKRRSSQ